MLNCNLTKDLLPLYIDGCCSPESAAAVEEHLRACADCRAVCEAMRAEPETVPVPSAPERLGRIQNFKASVLQSVLLFVSFAAITAGVTLEAATPAGAGNGTWALNLIVPATGFLLSLANWYFVRQYPDRKRFSACSLLATLLFSLCGYLWATVHFGLLSGEGGLLPLLERCWPGLLLTAALCVLSRLLSERYASLIGKE